MEVTDKNPIVFHTKVELPEELICPTNEQLAIALAPDLGSVPNRLEFGPEVGCISMWGASVDKSNYFKPSAIKSNEPHWLATVNGIEMHDDLNMPKYVYCLKIRVDAGNYVKGKDGTELKLERGTFYILDCHTPHEIFIKPEEVDGDDASYNVSIVIDTNDIIDPQEAIRICIDWGLKNDLLYYSGPIR